MTKDTDRLRVEVADLERQAAELEQQAATADMAELPSIGGTLAALAVKLKAARGKLADALSLEAHRERERKARAEAEARQELLDRAAALQGLWLAWLDDFDKADATIAGLWQRYAAMTEIHGGLSRDLSARDMLVGGDVLTFGSLTGAARESHAGHGRIVWRRG
jgi:hypothetical protein